MITCNQYQQLKKFASRWMAVESRTSKTQLVAEYTRWFDNLVHNEIEDRWDKNVRVVTCTLETMPSNRLETEVMVKLTHVRLEQG